MNKFDHNLCMDCKYFKEELERQAKHAHASSDLAIDMLFFAQDCFKSHKEDCLQKQAQIKNNKC